MIDKLWCYLTGHSPYSKLVKGFTGYYQCPTCGTKGSLVDLRLITSSKIHNLHDLKGSQYE